MKKIKGPTGTHGASFGSRLFSADQSGVVMVPDEAVPSLIGVGGFELIPTPDGFVVMRSLIGAQSVTSAGQSYETDANDKIVVPMAVADELISHQFEYLSVEEQEAVAAPAAVEPEEPAPVAAIEPSAAEPVDIPAIPLGEKPADAPVAAAPVETVPETVVEPVADTPVEAPVEPVVEAPVAEPAAEAVAEPSAEPAPSAPTAE